ncbi:MAG: acylphosphatase [Candidatus Campbellbacteria bacterium]|nr:acylphosphatase [Candidatus Campbellbacteria bacterium]
METRYIRITGQVQGVFFRSFAKEIADELNITGTAKNLTDGSVEIVAQGKKENLDRFVSLLKEGPRMAQVENIEEREYTGEESFDEFLIVG